MQKHVDLEMMKHKPHRATPFGGGIYPLVGTIIALVCLGVLVAIFW